MTDRQFIARSIAFVLFALSLWVGAVAVIMLTADAQGNVTLPGWIAATAYISTFAGVCIGAFVRSGR